MQWGDKTTIEKKTALIVEDETDIRKILVEELHLCGIQTTEAVDGCEGLALYSRGCFTIVITGIHMPRMNGVELVDSIRAKYPKQPILVMSASAEEQLDALRIRYPSLLHTLTLPFPLKLFRETVIALVNTEMIRGR